MAVVLVVGHVHACHPVRLRAVHDQLWPHLKNSLSRLFGQLTPAGDLFMTWPRSAAYVLIVVLFVNAVGYQKIYPRAKAGATSDGEVASPAMEVEAPLPLSAVRAWLGLASPLPQGLGLRLHRLGSCRGPGVQRPRQSFGGAPSCRRRGAPPPRDATRGWTQTTSRSPTTSRLACGSIRMWCWLVKPVYIRDVRMHMPSSARRVAISARGLLPAP